MNISQLVIPLFITCAVGCSTTRQIQVNSDSLFHDQAFPRFEQQMIETEADIFYLSAPVKRFMAENIFPVHGSTQRIKVLADTLFDHASLNLIYANEANTTASQTFINQQANCLSMTILAYAMAEHAGLDVVFQTVKTPEYWVRRDGFSLLNGHVNLKIKPKKDITKNVALQFGSEAVEVDFNTGTTNKRFPRTEISKRRVMSMFYNNKGADALLSRDFSQAYAYFKQAVITDTEFAPAWGNLGILYRQTHQLDWAESVYLYALSLDEDNLNNLENLALLKEITGEHQQADIYFQRIERKREDNPYYHFILGEEEYDKGNWQAAITEYHRALRLNNNVHEFYFGLAKSHYQLGNKSLSERYLKQAKRHSFSESLENRYQGKLDLLTRN